MDFEKFKIKEYAYWELFLHIPQYYLGSVYLWSKRNDEIDFLEMTNEEREEFFQIAKKVKRSLRDLYQVDRFNYANLQNIVNHLHIHIIPRYKSPRTIDNFKFEDENWGKMFYPYNESIQVPEEILPKIIADIKNKLK
jgi:diadenosine tetraphosphate (Ap4A) HIT family hydrolase